VRQLISDEHGDLRELELTAKAVEEYLVDRPICGSGPLQREPLSPTVFDRG
jgi:hypothetical protein